MKHKWTRNLSLKLLSLVVAFLIWILIDNIDNPTRSRVFRDVQIQVINGESVTEIDKVYDIVSEESVALKVTERRSVLDKLTQSDFTVTADLEDLNEMNTVPLSVTCSDPSVSWDEIEVLPSSMKVQLEQRKQSEFAVSVSVVGQPEKGFEVGQTEIVQGKTVQIAGPESMLNRIGQVVASVNVTHISNDQRLNATLSVYDKNGDPMQMNRLQVKDSSGAILSENTVMVDVSLWEVRNDIRVEVEVTGTPIEGYRLTDVSVMPETVNLVGTKEALDSLDGRLVLKEKISVDNVSESFIRDMDISETLAENDELRLVSEADPAVTVSVQIERSGDRTLQIPLSNLEVQNRPEEMNLAFSPADEITLQVHSDDQEAVITVRDIKASIDLDVCTEPGVYEIPVQVELPEGYTLTSDVNLVVTAEEQEKLPDEDGNMEE